jgi:hypothetical protein
METHWNYSGDFYVSALDGDDTTGTGTADSPVKTIGKAILLAEASPSTYTIVVGTGIYTEGLTSASTTNIIILQGDGVVILDGTGITNATSGTPNQWEIFNLTVVNFTNLLKTTSNYGALWKNCDFKNMLFNGVSVTTLSINENVFINCRFQNIQTANTLYIRYIKFLNCTFKDSAVGGTLAGSYNNNTYVGQFNNCTFSAPSGSFVVMSNNINTYSYPLINCVFQENLNVKVAGVTYTVPDWISTFPQVHINTTEASMSFNNNITASGDWNLLSTTMPINATTSDLYSRINTAPLNAAGGYAPRTAYGFDNDSSNPLHTAGGATWDNITTSSLGGFQISSSAVPSGSITTAVIDQGSIKNVKEIDAGWTTGFANTAAPSTYPSGSNNHNPVRYQYEMRYGNTTPLSGNYSIFEWGQIPYVNSNGTGSGDQLFNTSSYSPINARYLQLRITLRSDISGSI